MLAVIYARVSTDEQAQKGHSIPAQIESCQKYAKAHDFAVARVFEDQGESATSSNRPEFLEMIEYCKASRDIAAVIVYDTSRFARNREDAVVYKRLLEKSGVKVHYASQTISDDPEGKFLEGMLEVIDEHYSRALARVVKRGMTEAAKRGNWMGGPPYGYSLVRKEDGRRSLEIEPRQAEAVRLAFEMFQKGYGSIKIAFRLNELGYRTRSGKYLRSNSVEHILRNPAYTGSIVFNRFREGRRVKRAMLPKEEWIVVPNAHEAIIDKKTFDRIQIEMTRRGIERKPGEFKTLRRFGGLVQCSRCEVTAMAMTGTSRHGKRYFYYACRRRAKQARNLCSGFCVRADTLEGVLIDGIQSQIFSDKNIQQFVERVKAKGLELDNGRAHEKIRIQRKLEAIQGKLKRVVLLAEDESIDAAQAKERTQELKEERNALMELYARLQEELSLKDLISGKAVLEAARAELHKLLAESEPRAQREFFKRFIKSVKTDGRAAEVTYNLAYLAEGVLNSIRVGAPVAS